MTDASASSREAPAPTLTTARPLSARACQSQSQPGSRTRTGTRRSSTQTAVHWMRGLSATVVWCDQEWSAVMKRAT